MGSDDGDADLSADCYVNYAVAGDELRLRVKGRTDLKVDPYTVPGSHLYHGS
ncbi:MAG: hypothetical protein GXO39_03090 [Thermotogae bacterium]|nr:hypothetical protein [Thermotogota bacterium]